MALLMVLAVVGASAEHGADASQLRRGRASVVLRALFIVAVLAGIGSLALLFSGLVTRNRKGVDGSAPRRHSPVLVAGAALAVFACLTALLALAARGRHMQSLPPLGGRPSAHAATTTSPLPAQDACLRHGTRHLADGTIRRRSLQRTARRGIDAVGRPRSTLSAASSS
ncbi:MAG: hypothetical protein ACLPUG_14875 [Acidimicrobiales bacterium]